jgi:uncharacterized protein YeaC (DUF1315 family)
MMEETEMKTIQNLSFVNQIISKFTSEQFQKLRRHLETDRYPKEETLQALAEELKLRKEVIRYWFFKQHQREMKRKLGVFWLQGLGKTQILLLIKSDHQAEEIQGALSK